MTLSVEEKTATDALVPEATVLPVTVLIPVFDRAEALKRALGSVRAQTRSPAEVIVVDDGSRDSSGDVARTWGARVIRHDVNRGQVRARNTGIGTSTQPWIAFLDSDDTWLPHHLETLWSLRDGVLFAACSSINCRTDPSDDRVVGPLTRQPVLLRTAWRLVHPHNFVTMSTAMARRDALLELGGFRAHDGIVEDLDIWVRLLERGPARLSPQVTVVYQVHGVQITDDLPRTRAAHLSLAARYAHAGWPRSLIERLRGAQAWDDLRDALEAGNRGLAIRAAVEIARSPRRAWGTLELLRWRVRVRRTAARVTRQGKGTVALLVSAGHRRRVPPDLLDRERADLRGRRQLTMFRRLARRPAQLAVVDTPSKKLLARALGLQVVELR